jgi:putative two-component system response regulator
MDESKPTILIVDDLVENRKLLQDYTLVLGYESITSNDGLEALEKVEEESIDLVLLDMMMPKMGGLETLNRLKEDPKSRHIPVIMISALDEVEKVVQCIKIGAVDYLSKPFNPTLLKARIESALAAKKLHDREEEYRRKIENYNVQLESEVWKRTEEVTQVRQRVIHRLGRASEYRDNQTGLHVIRMSHYCSKLGTGLGWDKKQCDLIFHASPMHDVGKIGIPDKILLKADKLDHDEWEIMKTHSAMGAKILRGGESELELMAERIAMSHHEKWDGTGYPDGLEGNEIPLEARIVIIADVFDALTSHRPYKKEWSVEEATKYIEENSGTYFDPNLVSLFKEILPDIIKVKTLFAEGPL